MLRETCQPARVYLQQCHLVPNACRRNGLRDDNRVAVRLDGHVALVIDEAAFAAVSGRVVE